MLKVDLDIHQMFDVYSKEVRSILEMAVPVWHPGLTRQQSTDIENVQKMAMKIILQDKYVSYPLACSTLATKTLEERRLQLCAKFAAKNVKSSNSFFTKLNPSVNTRQPSNLVKEYRCNTVRYQKSSLPFLASLINTRHRKKWYWPAVTATCYLWMMGLTPGRWFWFTMNHKFVMLLSLPLVDVRK